MDDIASYLLASPIILVPVLIVVAMIVFSLIKRLLKMAAVLAIAGGLYVLLMEYMGPGL